MKRNDYVDVIAAIIVAVIFVFIALFAAQWAISSILGHHVELLPVGVLYLLFGNFSKGD